MSGSLPPALAAEGAEVAVVLPLYQKVKERFGDQLYFECYDYVDLAWRHTYCGLFSLQKDGVTWYFLDNEQYFARSELYGYPDDGERFAFFSRAVVRMLPHMKFWPDVVHCNDWQTALVPIYLKDDGVREDRFRSVRTALTIHNIEYQGRFNPYILGDLFGLDSGWAKDGTLLMDGDVNLLKGAILCADAVTAVSPTYAKELKLAYFAHRLEGIISRCEYKLSGVLNGIDMKLYDPQTDPRITVVRMLPHMKFWPDVVHCNDWQTALVPIYLKDDGVREDRFRSVRTALTIHNIEYQGRFNPYILGDLFGLDSGWAKDGTLLMDGDVNLLKGAILCADAVTAVSPTYAKELKLAYFAHRLEGIISRCEYKLSGVLNGIDMKLYDPQTDPRITANYSAGDMSGKDVDKAALQRILGLREEPYTPIVAIVSRLVSHKGLDLICEVLHDMMELPIQLVILGKGDRKYEEFFHWAAQQHSGRMAVRLDYNEDLSMAIYAGADLFLMPSKSEPCGLSQMIAMRYGTIPIVRETGGLKDTVQPYEAWRDSGNGFTFANYSSGDMLYVIREAVYPGDRRIEGYRPALRGLAGLRQRLYLRQLLQRRYAVCDPGGRVPL